MLTDFSFESNYRCQVLDELPNGSAVPRHFIPRRGDGVSLRITPNDGAPWIGTFAFGEFVDGMTRVLSAPDADRLFVVSSGDGFLISARDATRYERVNLPWITDARSVPAAGVVIFAGMSEVIAYDRDGVRWKTKLRTDDVKILSVSDTLLRGEYLDVGSAVMKPFVLNLLTGDV